MSTRLPAFEVLLDMARNDPDGLEALRESLTSAVIAGSQNEANRRRLKGLQFQVDMERTKAKTPLAATIRLSELMCQSLAELHRSMVESTEVSARAGHVVAGDSGTPAERQPPPLVAVDSSASQPPGEAVPLTEPEQKGATILPFPRL